MSVGNAVLDTSAIVSVLADEPGADFVEGRLEEADAGRIVLAVSFVSLTEITYTTIQVAGKRRADELLAILKSWPVQFIYPDEALCVAAGEIKAAFPVSLAAAFVAATAQARSAILIHKDREFESLRATIKLRALPYKRSRS